MAALCVTAVLPPSLHLWVPPFRLLSASVWQVVKYRQIENYTKVEDFVTVVLELVPSLLSTKERIELLLGLRTKVILELCRNDPSVTLQMLQPHLERLTRIAESWSDDMAETVHAAVKNVAVLTRAFLKNPACRKHYFQDIYPRHYGQQFDTALQVLVEEFLSRLELLLPVPSFQQVASWFDEDPLLLEGFLQMVHDPKPIQVLLDHCKDLRRLRSGSSSIMTNTILTTLSDIHSPTLQALLSDCEQAEQGVSAPQKERRSSLNDSDTLGDSDDEDWSADVDEGDLQSDSDEGQSDASQHDQYDHQRDPEHLATHTPQLHACSKCDKIFFQKCSLENHQKCHSRVRHHLCSYCGKTVQKLQAHIRIHTGQRPYECPVCGKRFRQNANFVIHKRLHTGEKPYLCTFCGKAFPGSGALMLHTRVHTGERPFKCEFCKKTYTMSSSLAQHRRVHTKERPYTCSVCSKQFARCCQMKRHMRTHTGEKPYECGECGKKFAVHSNMKIHQRVHRKK